MAQVEKTAKVNEVGFEMPSDDTKLDMHAYM